MMKIRDLNKDKDYFDWLIPKYMGWIEEDFQLERNNLKPESKTGNVYDLCRNCFHLVVLCYGRGDPVETIRPAIWRWVEAKEMEARILSVLPAGKSARKLYLHDVYNSLTILSFVRALHFKPEEIKRVLAATGHVGEDALIDLAAQALGDNSRAVSPTCKYPKVYQPLLEVWQAEPAQRAVKLKTFTDQWKRKIKPIYWSSSLEGAEGAYFGYWCFDIALAAIVLDIADDAMRPNPYYPSDLVDAACSARQPLRE